MIQNEKISQKKMINQYMEFKEDLTSEMKKFIKDQKVAAFETLRKKLQELVGS